MGQQYVYDLEFEQQIQLKQTEEPQTAAKAAGPLVLSALTAQLSATVVEKAADRVYVQYLLRPSALSFDSDGKSALDERSRSMMLQSLRSPFYVQFNPQGAAVTLHLEQGVDLLSQNVLRSLVASIQVVTPPEAMERWPAQEVDTTGRYEASYQRLEGAREFEKKKVRYQMVTTPEGLRPLPGSMRITVAGGAHLVLDEGLWVDTLRGEERVEVVPGPGLPTAIGDSKVRLRLREKHSIPLLVGAFSANQGHLLSSEFSVQTVIPQDPRAQLRRVLAGGTLASLTGALRMVPKLEEAQRGPVTAELMQRLNALFQLEPGAAAQVPELIRQERSREVYSPFIGSLSSASTPEAVQALAQISSDAMLPTPVRVDAIAGLGTTETPTPEGADALRRLSQSPDEELRTTATLALGNAARRMNELGDSTGETLLRELEQLLRAESDPARQALLLKALSNTADPRALPTIQAALRSSSWIVREAAVGALRLIQDPTVDQLLSERLLGDDSPFVRRGAVFASSFRSLQPLFPAMGQALRSERESAVRNDIVRLLGERRTREPQAGVLLAWVSQNDPDADIRQFAGTLLAPPGAQP
ncbi:HEAT repeat domain-containing protein [Myxococcus sp. SDU36]|uniref:HEAT repeat domain-containing protein n=1 Tax=Myxococcus sp. SDU36 TaxID=2831967 RepID=UPI00254334C1|nr:HEAT repeat domain-containing protein [Myxococcus sp. SDU36]WIG96743.1 HEAT repeat domain-containing protein [Myxococcus sp. SDU36]